MKPDSKADIAAKKRRITAMPMNRWRSLVDDEPEHELVAFAKGLLPGSANEAWLLARWTGRNGRPRTGPGELLADVDLLEYTDETSTAGYRYRATALGERVAVALGVGPDTKPSLAAPKVNPTSLRAMLGLGPRERAPAPVGWDWAKPNEVEQLYGSCANAVTCGLVKRRVTRRDTSILEAVYWDLYGAQVGMWQHTPSRSHRLDAEVVQAVLDEHERQDAELREQAAARRRTGMPRR